MQHPRTRSFLDLFSAKHPVLQAKFDIRSSDPPETIMIQNRLFPQRNTDSNALLHPLFTDPRLNELLEFYRTYDGFELATPIHPTTCVKKPLLRQVSAIAISSLTRKFQSGGEYAYAMEYNKSKNLYRNGNQWIAFAQINDSASCLTTFLDGELAGQIFMVEPEPKFNILRPIASSYTHLLNRIAKEPALFLKLIRATIAIHKADGYLYGYVPVQYID